MNLGSGRLEDPDNVYYYGYYDNKQKSVSNKGSEYNIFSEQPLLRPKPIDIDELIPSSRLDDIKWEV